MYYDLNLSWPNNPLGIQLKKERVLRAAEELVELGFRVLAFNFNVDLPYPSKLNVDFLELDEWKQRHPGVTCLKRLTLVMDDVHRYHQFIQTQPILKSFDIVAVCPITEKAWSQCCTDIECDLLTLDYTNKLPFYFKPTMMNEAIRRGLHFEITFVPALKDDTSKRNLIANARNLIRITQGKNVIISSGANEWMETRGPLDIINLGCLFGINMDKAKHAITLHPRAALLHATTRTQTYRAAASVVSLSQLGPEGRWKAGQFWDSEQMSFIALEDEDTNPTKKKKIKN